MQKVYIEKQILVYSHTFYDVEDLPMLRADLEELDVHDREGYRELKQLIKGVESLKPEPGIKTDYIYFGKEPLHGLSMENKDVPGRSTNSRRRIRKN